MTDFDLVHVRNCIDFLFPSIKTYGTQLVSSAIKPQGGILIKRIGQMTHHDMFVNVCNLTGSEKERRQETFWGVGVGVVAPLFYVIMTTDT